MRENKSLSKFFFSAFLLICVLCGSASAAQMDLTQEDARMGPVSVMERDGMLFVALEEVMARLSLVSSPLNGGFIVIQDGRRIEFWNGTNVARVNGEMSPLPAAVNFDGVHWWSDASSSLQAIRKFLSSTSRPSNIGLVPSASPAVNTPPAASAPPPPAAPPPATATPPPTTPPPAAPPPVSAPPLSPLPLPGEAIISRVRWGEQTDAYRAVIDITGEVEAVMAESPGRAEVTFKGAGTLFTSGRSPWPQIMVEAQKTGDGVMLAFTHSSDAIRGFWVADPARYVVDFYFSGTGPQPAQTAQAPGGIGTGNAPAAVPQNIPSIPQQGARPARSGFLVVIDAGHGGHDPGAVGNGLREKDINLLAALQLGISLRTLGIDTRLTRQDDRFLRLAERSDIANEANADVFISLHCNALPQGQRATGTELYLMAEPTDQDALNLAMSENRELSGGAESIEEINAAADRRTLLLLQILGDMQQSDKINESTNLAEFVYNELNRANVEIRKVRQAPFYVLRGAGMASLLIEMGYISEASDARKLNSQDERKKLMDMVATGIRNYLTQRPGEGGTL